MVVPLTPSSEAGVAPHILYPLHENRKVDRSVRERYWKINEEIRYM